jgi:hypothetical protein
MVNMCGQMVQSPDSQACRDSLVCIYSESNASHWKRLGSQGHFRRQACRISRDYGFMTESLSVEGNDVLLRYEDGDFCQNGPRATSTFHLRCSEIAQAQ